MAMAERLHEVGIQRPNEKTIAAAAAIALCNDGLLEAATTLQYTRTLKTIFMNMPHQCLVGPIQYPDDPAGLAASHPVLWAMLLEKCPCVESKVPLLAAAALKAAQPCRVSKTGCGGSDKSQSTQHQLARLGGPLLGGPPNKIPKTLVNFLENMANPHHQQPQQPSATITFGNGRLRNSDGRS
jgi:hypothetical protein